MLVLKTFDGPDREACNGHGAVLLANGFLLNVGDAVTLGDVFRVDVSSVGACEWCAAGYTAFVEASSERS